MRGGKFLGNSSPHIGGLMALLRRNDHALYIDVRGLRDTRKALEGVARKYGYGVIPKDMPNEDVAKDFLGRLKRRYGG